MIPARRDAECDLQASHYYPLPAEGANDNFLQLEHDTNHPTLFVPAHQRVRH